MKNKPSDRPFFLFLLPVFFVFHGWVENFRFLSFSDCWPLILLYIAAALVLYLLGWLLFKDAVKASLVATFVLSFYFFFGVLHDFLRKHDISLHRYSILLPVFLVMTIGLILYLRKKRSLSRITLFLNILLFAFLLADGVSLAWKTGSTALSKSRSTAPAGYLPCDTCANPDIYFLLFDGYSASRTLKDVYHYDNSGLDSFLDAEGFHRPAASRSNYFITPFSMASILNYSYLHLADPMHLRAGDYNDIFEPIRRCEVVNYLSSRGYDIINNSPFDLPGHPSSADQPFIPVKSKLITNRTLINYVLRDMEWWFEKHFTNPSVLSESRVAKTDRLNGEFLSRTIAESSKRSVHPRFVYAHLLMPHFPFLFDSSLHRRKPADAAGQLNENEVAPYLGYLPYTNLRIKELITAIRKNSGGKAVIIFMSDHGFRHSFASAGDREDFFNNQNAVYFPDRDYRLLYDSISAVNEFRIVFDKLFRQNIPLLKDSTLFLQDIR